MFERGDLLLVPFPFSDLSATKRRPVLALTAPDEYGGSSRNPTINRALSQAVGLANSSWLGLADALARWHRMNYHNTAVW